MTLPELIPIDVLFGNPERHLRTSPPTARGSRTSLPTRASSTSGCGRVDRTTRTRDQRPPPRDPSVPMGVRRTALLYLQDPGGDENWRLYTVDLETGGGRRPHAVRRRAGTHHRRVGARAGRDPRRPQQGRPAVPRRLSADAVDGELTKEVATRASTAGSSTDDRSSCAARQRPRRTAAIAYLLRDGDDWRARSKSSRTIT